LDDNGRKRSGRFCALPKRRRHRFRLEGREKTPSRHWRNWSVQVCTPTSVIELYSAFTKKVRTGEIDEVAFHDPIRGLAKDIQETRVQVVTLGEVDKRVAIALLETHGITESLRTLDALQLAVLKGLSGARVTEVYCADQQFVALLEQEGFSVVNPEDVEIQ
jgi:hypothetical protein